MNAPLASVEGRIDIVLARDATGRCRPSITSTRPFDLPKSFLGKPVETVAATVGLLFSVCGQAQQAASLGAIEAALSLDVSNEVVAARAGAVRAETLREAVLRTNKDFGPSVREVVTHAYAIAKAAKPAFAIGSAVAPLAPDAMAQLEALAAPLISDPAASGNDHGVPLLTPRALAEANLIPDGPADSGLADEPTVGGQPHRTFGASPFDDEPLYAFRNGAPGWGIASVPTARGLLTHAVRTANGIVTAYRITAPTEWNFHPDGIVARRLAAMDMRADWLNEARQIVAAIDPCVEAHIRMQEVANA